MRFITRSPNVTGEVHREWALQGAPFALALRGNSGERRMPRGVLLMAGALMLIAAAEAAAAEITVKSCSSATGACDITIESDASEANLSGPEQRISPARAQYLPEIRVITTNTQAIRTGDPRVIAKYRLQYCEIVEDCGYNDAVRFGTSRSLQNDDNLIPHNYVEATSIDVIFGGADAWVNNLTPSNIPFGFNHVAKNHDSLQSILQAPIDVQATAGIGGNHVRRTRMQRRATVQARARPTIPVCPRHRFVRSSFVARGALVRATLPSKRIRRSNCGR
jgi:hypothetical protein